jgi:hypothetical protein
MSNKRRRLAVRLVPLALGLGVIGMIGSSIGNVDAGQGGAGMRCEIAVKKRGGGVELAGVVHASAPVQGSYVLTVTKSGSGGSSDISQSGDFSAGPGKPGYLGNVMIGGDGGSYVAKLRVTGDGGSSQCVERGRL